MKLESLCLLGRISQEKLCFLYALLGEREAHQNISHRKMPTFEEHVEFVKSGPYAAWDVIVQDGELVGSIYITYDNEIGIHVSRKWIGAGVGSDALEAFMKKNPRNRYLANINPDNVGSIKFFERHEFKLLQLTYELEV